MRAGGWIGRLGLLLPPLLAACSMSIGQVSPRSPMPSGPSFDRVVAVEDVYTLPDDWGERWQRQTGLRRAILEAQIFSRVVAPSEIDFEPDLVVRARVQGRFEYSGLLNFLTWFPGPFVLMPHWRGNRYEYLTHADVDLLHGTTREVLHRYDVEARHRLVHRSPTPFPILGAVIIFPGLIRGGTNAAPRSAHRRELYEQAYPDLWRAVASEIHAEREPYYAQQRRELEARCGERLNERPVAGMPWEAFVACQTASFHAREGRDSPDGVTTVFANPRNTIEVHVVEGRIVHWKTPERPGPRPRRPPPPM